MPRGILDSTRFRMAFSHGFFYQEVIDAIMPTIKSEFVPVEKLEDYINPNIMTGRVPGLSDEGSPPQITTSIKGGKSRSRTETFKGSRPAEENITREISLDMLMDDGYLTWLTMYLQTAYFLSLDNKDSFLPPIVAQFMDYNDDIIMEIVYSKIMIREIVDVDLQVQDNGITTRTFTVRLAYNDSKIIPYTNRVLNPRRGGDAI